MDADFCISLESISSGHKLWLFTNDVSFSPLSILFRPTHCQFIASNQSSNGIIIFITADRKTNSDFKSSPNFQVAIVQIMTLFSLYLQIIVAFDFIRNTHTHKKNRSRCLRRLGFFSPSGFVVACGVIVLAGDIARFPTAISESKLFLCRKLKVAHTHTPRKLKSDCVLCVCVLVGVPSI